MLSIYEIELTEEIRNRLRVWSFALHRSYSYIMTEEYMNKNKDEINNDLNYSVSIDDCYTHVSYAACGALIESAIVLFYQVFTTGSEGPGIAGNRGNSVIDQIRELIISSSLSILKWSQEEFDEFMKQIRDMRNQVIAHYDGSKAGYEEVAPNITKMKMVGGYLLTKDKIKLRNLVAAMIDCTIRVQYRDDLEKMMKQRNKTKSVFPF